MKFLFLWPSARLEPLWRRWHLPPASDASRPTFIGGRDIIRHLSLTARLTSRGENFWRLRHHVGLHPRSLGHRLLRAVLCLCARLRPAL